MKEKITVGKVWGIIYPILIHTAISTLLVNVWYIMTYILLLKSGRYSSNESILIRLEDMVIENTLLLILAVSLIAIPIMIIFRCLDIKKEKKMGVYVKYKKPFVGKYLLIIPFAIFCMMAGNYFSSILTMFMSEGMVSTYDNTQEAIYGSSFVLQVITAGIAGPIVEELIFRGLIYNRIKKMTGVVLAAILSGVIFGAYHGNWVQAPYAIIIGLVCVYVYEKYKSIIAPIILHITANMFSLVISLIVLNMPSGEMAIPTFSEQLTALLAMTIVTGILAWIFGIIIEKTVKVKEK